MLDYLKLNVDGSCHEQQRSAGWGFIIRHEHGGVVGSGAGKIDHCHDARSPS